VCSVLVSEENEEPIIVDPATEATGPYCVAFDPLDGSSNIDCNVSVGSIFSIYKRENFDRNVPGVTADILRPGTDIVAAGYAMYGASTELVITYEKGSGVERFQLDPSIGEFMFIEKMGIPKDGGKKIYSCNEGNSVHWDQPIKDFVEQCKKRVLGALRRFHGE